MWSVAIACPTATALASAGPLPLSGVKCVTHMNMSSNGCDGGERGERIDGWSAAAAAPKGYAERARREFEEVGWIRKCVIHESRLFLRIMIDHS